MKYIEATIEVIKINSENIMTLSNGGSGTGGDVDWGDFVK